MQAKSATNAQRKRNREAADWILRNGEPHQSSADKARFKDWLEQDPENFRTYRAAERLMGDAQMAIESDESLVNIKVKPRNSVKAVTATLLVAALLAGTFFALDGPMRLEADVITGANEMPVITLEDGSEIQLNASSAIAIDFTDKRRTIRLLRGQAFFMVAHATGRPFSVVAGTARVTALGTAFDVRYGNDDTEVTVTEHAVQIELDGNHTNSVRVKQGEQAIYNYAKNETTVSPVDGRVALAWKRGQIAVDNAPLSHVVEEMNRHFYGQIVVTSSVLANRRVSGTIEVAHTDEALSFIAKALGVKITRLGPLIIIRR